MRYLSQRVTIVSLFGVMQRHSLCDYWSHNTWFAISQIVIRTKVNNGNYWPKVGKILLDAVTAKGNTFPSDGQLF